MDKCGQEREREGKKEGRKELNKWVKWRVRFKNGSTKGAGWKKSRIRRRNKWIRVGKREKEKGRKKEGRKELNKWVKWRERRVRLKNS